MLTTPERQSGYQKMGVQDTSIRKSGKKETKISEPDALISKDPDNRNLRYSDFRFFY
jgi:hypothetical protein